MNTKAIDYEWLEEEDACREAVGWLQTQPNVRQAWESCIRGDWMLWLVQALNADEMLLLRLNLTMLKTPLHDGHTVEDLLTDERSIAFVALKRRKFAGEAIDSAQWDAAVSASADASADASAYAYAAKLEAQRWQAKAVREVVPDILQFMKLEAQS